MSLRKSTYFYFMAWMLGVAFCDDDIIGLEGNLALRKPTLQSSTRNARGRAKKAVDGRANTNYLQGSCSHTAYDWNPWWAVDLLTPAKVTAVVITNRGDCCSQRLHNFDILVGDSLNMAATNKTICASHPAPVARGATVIFLCPEPLPRGRFVKIQMRGRRHLTLCEVKVYGKHGDPEVTSCGHEES